MKWIRPACRGAFEVLFLVPVVAVVFLVLFVMIVWDFTRGSYADLAGLADHRRGWRVRGHRGLVGSPGHASVDEPGR